jgi:hypothetical protein
LSVTEALSFEEAATMKKISNHQRAARKHNTDESGESFREAVKAGKKAETTADKKVKKISKAFREDDATQDRPSKLKD